jgi:hypothetical protein
VVDRSWTKMRQGHPRRFGATKQISRGGNRRLEVEIAQSGMLGTTQGAQTQTAAATPIRLGREGMAGGPLRGTLRWMGLGAGKARGG